MKRIHSLILGALIGATTLAQPTQVTVITPRGGQATVTLTGQAQTESFAVLREYTRQSLGQVCAKGGPVLVVTLEGNREVWRKSIAAGQCLHLQSPSGQRNWVQRFSAIFNQSNNAGGQSRGGVCQEQGAPGLTLIEGLELTVFAFPVSGRPNPKTLTLFDAAGQEVLSITSSVDRAVFELPQDALRRASTVVVRAANRDTLYTSEIARDRLLETPQSPVEIVDSLLSQNLVELAPLAYNYLRQLDPQAAAELEQQIRTRFQCRIASR